MSAASSPLAPSPQPGVARAPRVCLNCKRKKKGCNKALPSCNRCVESLQECKYEDDFAPDSVQTPVYSLYGGGLSPISNAGPVLRHSSQSWGSPSLVGSIHSAIDIHHLAFCSMMEILGDRQGIEQVVSSYFGVAHTWITIIDHATFESQLKSVWQKSPLAETCILVLCMSLLTRQSTAIPNGPLSDGNYHSVKALMSLVQSSGQRLSNTSIQAELLVTQYEYSNALPQQAYFSVGRCFQMSRIFGWHSKLFWEEEKQRNFPSELKLASALWWAIVHADSFISVAYAEQKFPMHTANLNLGFEIPLPKDFDQYLPAAFLGQPFVDSPTFDIDGMALPEATSSWCLSNALQQLYHPTLPDNREQLSGAILNHAVGLDRVPRAGPWVNGDHSGAMATSLIALMKLNAPGLLPGMAPSALASTSSAEKVRWAIGYIYGAVQSVEQYRILVKQGLVAPSWAFAMLYAALLLINHGNGVLGDIAWPQKVENLRNLLELHAQRWRIAGIYVKQINMALANRPVPYAA